MANVVKFTCILLFAGAAFAQNEPAATQNLDTQAREAAQTRQRRPVSAYLVTGQPYSADQTNDHFQTLIDGTHLIQHVATAKVYRDSAGRFRIDRTEGIAPPLYITKEIFDPAAGIQYNLDATRPIARKSQFRETFTGLTPSIGCPADLSAYTVPAFHSETACTALGTKKIDGLDAVGARIITVIPIGAMGNDKPISSVTEIWVSPELKVVLLQTVSDPRNGDLTQKLTNISRKEPDTSLFRPPDDYRIIAIPAPAGRGAGDQNPTRP
jgi:hypothetical protein